MSAKVSDIFNQPNGADIAVYDASYQVSLEISEQRDKTEREIKRLAESGFRDEAWKLLVKHLQIKEPRQK